jgi:hypothetical protein
MNSARQFERFPQRYEKALDDFIEFAVANQKQRWNAACYSVILLKEIIFFTQ